MIGEVASSGITVKPTAWFWWTAALTSLVATIVLAICGALVSFSARGLPTFANGWSTAFWLLLFASIALFCVSIVLLPASRRREVRAGYTTLPAMVREIEWRDHATGLVLRYLGEPTPTGSLSDLRKAARERNEGSA